MCSYTDYKAGYSSQDGWSVERFRNIFSFGKGLSITKENLEDKGIPVINYGEIHSKYGFELVPGRDVLQCVPNSYLKKGQSSLLHRGDFIFADTSEDLQGAGNFTYLNGDERIFAGYHTVITRLKRNWKSRIDIRYLAYFLDSNSYRVQIRSKVKGVKVYSITQSILKDTYISFPSVDKQILIVKYLDEKVQKIHEAIALKEEQIAFLKERKQAITQQALTKGLDSNVLMRESGVPGLGMIPDHWQLKRLKYIIEERNERSRTGEEPLFMVSQVHGLVVRADYHAKAEVAASNVDSKIVHKNDLVFNKLKAHLGVFFKSTIDFKGLVSPDYAVYKSKAYIEDLKILELLFRHPAYIEQFVTRATGIVEGLIRLYTSDLFDIFVPVAPSHEQKLIIDFVQLEGKKHDVAIKLHEEQILKLKEYKTTLINSAVTGKIKVTELA